MDRRRAARSRVPAAAPAVGYEEVWRLLLQHCWNDPDKQMICKLLCVSASMTQLVHSTCEGRMRVRLLSKHRLKPKPKTAAFRQWLGPVQIEAQLWSRWLAKHARLLGSLDVLVWPEQEAAVAAGLQAAGGSSSAAAAADQDYAVRTTRSVARLTADAEAAAATGPGGGKQGLLLRWVELQACLLTPSNVSNKCCM
jgi:hypothetical protein